MRILSANKSEGEKEKNFVAEKERKRKERSRHNGEPKKRSGNMGYE